jgi:hypothetical protein
MTNPIKKIIKHLKNNPKHYWFKRKLYGWGWTPATIEGWAITLLFLAYIIIETLLYSLDPVPTPNTMNSYIIRMIIAVILLILICYTKGEKPRWSWGKYRYLFFQQALHHYPSPSPFLHQYNDN